MKKTIFIVLICLLITNLIAADEFTDILKQNTGKLINVYLKNYNPVNNNGIISYRGIIEKVSNDVLVIVITKNDAVSNPTGPDQSGKMYIRISEIAAFKIAD